MYGMDEVMACNWEDGRWMDEVMKGVDGWMGIVH